MTVCIQAREIHRRYELVDEDVEPEEGHEPRTVYKILGDDSPICTVCQRTVDQAKSSGGPKLVQTVASQICGLLIDQQRIEKCRDSVAKSIDNVMNESSKEFCQSIYLC